MNSMTYVQSETEAIQVFVLRYKELPEQQRQYARHKTKCLSVWQGTTPQVRAFNAKLLAALHVAEGDLRLASKHTADIEPFKPPTFVQVALWFRPIVYFIVCAGGVVWLGLAVVEFIKGTLIGVGALAKEYGGYLLGGGLAAFLLSQLPKIEWSASQPKQTTHEKFEQETFYQKTSYEKTTTNG